MGERSREEKIQEFLEWYRPGGPWDLAAIEPDGTLIGRRFKNRETPALTSWVRGFVGKRNLYFHVNRLAVDVKGKASMTDVSHLDWLHVDVDPRQGEDIEKEQRRALGILKNPPDGVPRPSLIVMSGGGYQAFWRLSSPLSLEGNASQADDASRWNKHLETIFGADHCHNIDRLMRLPFTFNLPDKRKRRLGRQRAETYVEFTSDDVFDLSEFIAAPKVDKGGSQVTRTVSVSSNVQRLDSVDDLDSHLENPAPDWLKVLIVQGNDPLRPDRWPSRSEALFACVCELARLGGSADLMYSIITDPDFEISSSVVDKRSGMDRYALRQIEKAMDAAVDPNLAELNSRHAIIENMGGKCRIVEMIPGYTGIGETFTSISFTDFTNRYMNRLVQTGTREDGSVVKAELGKWWLRHPRRRQFHTIVFSPGREIDRCYNLWRGFAVEPRPGDCTLFLTHVRKVICGGSSELYEYVMNWMARAIQDPASTGETALVMRGKMGVGKGAFARFFGQLFGSHFLHITDPKHLVGNHNQHLRTCVVLFADEAFFAGDRRQSDKLQTLITEPTLMIEPKHVDAVKAPNFVHLLMASNRDWVIPAGPHERRYVVLDVSDERIQDHRHFAKMQTAMSSGGSEALLHLLLHRDISKFNVRAVPMTAGLQDQKIRSFSSEEEWFYNLLTTGTLLDGEWEAGVLKDSLYNNYVRYSGTTGNKRSITKTAWGMFLRRATPGEEWPKSPQRPMMIEGKRKRPRFLEFPTLEECRAHWDKNFGGPFNWPPEPEVRSYRDEEEAY